MIQNSTLQHNTQYFSSHKTKCPEWHRIVPYNTLHWCHFMLGLTFSKDQLRQDLNLDCATNLEKSFARNLELVRVWVGRRQWREELSAGGRRRRPQMRAKFTSNVNNNNISPHQMASLKPDLSLSRQLAGCHQVGQTFLHPWQGMWIIHLRTLCYFETMFRSPQQVWARNGTWLEVKLNKWQMAFHQSKPFFMKVLVNYDFFRWWIKFSQKRFPNIFL